MIPPQKALVFETNYKGKDKFSTGLFIDTLYKEHILPDETVQENNLVWWSRLRV